MECVKLLLFHVSTDEIFCGNFLKISDFWSAPKGMNRLARLGRDLTVLTFSLFTIRLSKFQSSLRNKPVWKSLLISFLECSFQEHP